LKRLSGPNSRLVGHFAFDGDVGPCVPSSQTFRVRSSLPRTRYAPHRHLFAPASLGNIAPAPLLRRTYQQAPRLAIFLKHPLTFRPIVKVHRRPRNKRIRRNHIPQILSDHIRRQKVDVVQRVECSAPGSPGIAARASMAGRALHLHSPKPPATLHRKVIRTAVSPRLQHGKAEHRCLRQKRSLHSFAKPLARGRRQAPNLNNFLLSRRIRFFRHKKKRGPGATPYLLYQKKSAGWKACATIRFYISIIS